MRKAVFFSGAGTSYRYQGRGKEGLELYPETIPALRILVRRGFVPILAVPQRQEYKWFVSSIKDKTLNIHHWDIEGDLQEFMIKNCINKNESCFITDGIYSRTFINIGCKVILVLSGRGFCTLTDHENGYSDISKDIYAAAFSTALNSSL